MFTIFSIALLQTLGDFKRVFGIVRLIKALLSCRHRYAGSRLESRMQVHLWLKAAATV